MAVLIKEKVNKIEIYDSKERHLGTTKVFSFPKTLFKGTAVPISIKCSTLPFIAKGEQVMLIFEYVNGDRYRGVTRVDASTKVSLDVKIADVTEIEERRRYFKVKTNELAVVYKTRAAAAQGIPAVILNINLGGVLLACEESLVPGECYYINTFGGQLEIYAKILRKQINKLTNELEGYGCQFQEVTEQQEEMLSRYIMDCQLAERERLRAQDDMLS